MIDTEAKTRIYQPKRFFNGSEIRQAVAIIDAQAEAGLMWPHGKKELHRMARKGELTLLAVPTDDGEKVVGVGGITQKHRTRRVGKIQVGRVVAAEFGALALDTAHQGNGYGRDIVEASAQNFLQKLSPTRDVLLFAMAKVTNAGSNKLFQRLSGNPIDQQLLPKAARGDEFNAYDITPVGRRPAGQ